MDKLYKDSPLLRARCRAEFLITSINALAEDTNTPDFEDWGYFSDGLLATLKDLAIDLDEALNGEDPKEKKAEEDNLELPDLTPGKGRNNYGR